MTQKVLSASQTESQRTVTDWGCLRWLADGKKGNAQGLTLGRVSILPGKSNPRHAHCCCDEILYLLKGTLAHTVGDDTVILQAGDTLTVAPGVFHNATALGDEEADMIVAYSSPERDFVLESPKKDPK